jgi:renalase
MLADEGVIRTLEGNIIGQREDSSKYENFVAPGGIGAVVKAIAKGVDLKSGRRVQGLEKVASPAGGWQWEVTLEPKATPGSAETVPGKAGSDATSAADDKHLYDGVVLTMPAPQVLQLKGSVVATLEESGAASALRGVQYSSRYALAMWWPEERAEELAKLMPWTGQYVGRDAGSDIRYLSFEPRKRQSLQLVPGAAASESGGVPRETLAPGADPPALVAHTGIGFGERRLEDDMDAVGEELQEQVRRLLPGLPEAAEIRCHRWRYSQVQVNAPAAAVASGLPVLRDGDASAPDQSTQAAWIVSTEPLLVLAGDSLTESNLDGCIASGEAAAAAVTTALAGRA